VRGALGRLLPLPLRLLHTNQNQNQSCLNWPPSSAPPSLSHHSGVIFLEINGNWWGGNVHHLLSISSLSGLHPWIAPRLQYRTPRQGYLPLPNNLDRMALPRESTDERRHPVIEDSGLERLGFTLVLLVVTSLYIHKLKKVPRMVRGFEFGLDVIYRHVGRIQCFESNST
jgi:hypothetical protein